MKPISHLIKTLVVSLLFISPTVSQSATIASDGGVTLWLSYDDLVSPGASLSDDVTVILNNSNCQFVNDARNAQGLPDSPGSCGDGTIGQTCTGEEKLIGDLEKFAEHLYESTEGTHYLRHVYISDEGRSWETADIRWSIGNSGNSSAWPWGWEDTTKELNIRRGLGACTHELLLHEFGHYFYSLPDRYQVNESDGYYEGTLDGSTSFDVGVCVPDPNTLMTNNGFPHQFVDTTNASIAVSYDPPGSGHFDCANPDGTGGGQVLTPGLLSDGDPNNDGPRWNGKWGFNLPYAQDEWSYMPDNQIDLTGIHTEGDFSDPNFDDMPEPQFHIIGADAVNPGIILLLDRSGSMQVETNGVSAAQFVQEAGLYLYHSTPDGQFVGAYVYNAGVDPLFEYAEYDSNFALPSSPGQAPLLNPTGATNIALALETAIDAFVDEHGEGEANGGQIFLMSDGKQTTGNDLFDQVDRANQLGIKIHTFTYGNADAATMAQISSTTSGDGTAMSAAENGSELKLGMAKQFSLIRGNTPIYSFKGKLTKSGVTGGVEFFEDAFSLPPTAQNLRFYAFQADGNASELDIRLRNDTGQNYQVAATALTDKGRFAGTQIESPQPGEWLVRILADKKRKVLPKDAVEIVAYADDRNLDGKVWFKSGPNSVSSKMQLRAFLDYRYVLTDMKVLAHLYHEGNRVTSIRMYDDGKKGGDNHRADGIYSADLDLRQLARKAGLKWTKGEYGIENPKIRIDVQYLVNKNSVPAPNYHYSRGGGYQELLDDYRPAEFEAWTTLVHAFSRKSPKPVLQRIRTRTAVPGRNYRTTVGILNARPQAGEIRLSIGPGIKTQVHRVTPRRDRLGVNLSVSYRIDRDAEAGPRSLKVQFGDALLVGESAVTVRRNQQSRTASPDRPSTSIESTTRGTTVPNVNLPSGNVGGTLQAE